MSFSSPLLSPPGDKSPITTGGRITGLLWQFSGVIFLGLFAATLSANMTRIASDRGFQSIQDLKPTHKVCTETVYEDLLQSYPFTTYLATYPKCLVDLQEGKTDGVYYDDSLLKRHTLGRQFKVVLGDVIRFNGIRNFF